jgi:hypothetical protein
MRKLTLRFLPGLFAGIGVLADKPTRGEIEIRQLLGKLIVSFFATIT